MRILKDMKFKNIVWKKLCYISVITLPNLAFKLSGRSRLNSIASVPLQICKAFFSFLPTLNIKVDDIKDTFKNVYFLETGSIVTKFIVLILGLY